jgi:carboxymethylenebutenolidase
MSARYAFVFLLTCGIAISAVAKPRDPGFTASTAQFESGKKKITIDVLSPSNGNASKKLPAIILVHGFDGIKAPHIDYRKHAGELAARGYIVLIPHYFESTDSSLLDPTKFWTDAAKNGPVWLKTVQDSVAFAAKQPRIDEKRIGLLGFSLGSYIATYVAAQETKVAAVVEYYGGVFPGVDQLLNKRPPILILHGDADKIISVDEAKKLATICTDHDIDSEMKIYKGQGHGFFGPDDDDARKRAAEWFDKKMPEKK